MNVSDEEFTMLDDLVSSIYNRGIKDGMEISENMYQQGLNDAWECARKIILSCGEGGYDAGTIKDIFGMSYHDVLKECKPNKAIELIKEYEEQQKQDDTGINDGSIKVGDEIYFEGHEDKKVVTNIDDGIICAFSPNGLYITCTENSHKTGRNFPQIAEVLKLLKGKE